MWYLEIHIQNQNIFTILHLLQNLGINIVNLIFSMNWEMA